jgi:hypothetical protein
VSGETIWCHFVLANFLNDDITTVMNSYWIDSVFTLELKPSASSRVCLTCTVPRIAFAMMILHSFICKGRWTTNVSETARTCLGSSCSTFYGAEQFFIAESHCFSTKPTLWMLCGCSCKAFWWATFVMIK